MILGSSAILVFKIFGAVLMLGVNLIISNIYGAKHLGVFNLLLIILQIGSMVSRVGIDVYILKILPTLVNKNNAGAFLKRAFIIVLTSSILIACLVLVSSPLIDTLFFENFNAINSIWWIVLLLTPYTFFTVIPEILRAYNDIKLFSFLKYIIFQLSLILSLIFIVVNNFNEPVAIIYVSIIISFIVSALVLLRFISDQSISFFQGEYNQPIISSSIHMFFTSSILYLMATVDQFMIGYFLSETYVGYYVACLKISLIITFILSSVTSYVTPQISKAYHSKDFLLLKNLYKKSTRLIIYTSAPIILIILAFSEQILAFFGDEFRSLVNVLYIIIVMNVFNIFFGPLLYVLNMMDQERYVKNIILIAFLINILLNIFLIPLWNIQGAAVATLCSTFLWKFLLYTKLKKILKYEF